MIIAGMIITSVRIGSSWVEQYGAVSSGAALRRPFIHQFLGLCNVVFELK
jgi:hypothetical protein